MTRTNIQECTLVPVRLFDEKEPGRFLYDVSQVRHGSEAGYVRFEGFGAVLVYEGPKEPALADVLRKLPGCGQYNKVVASYSNCCISLAVAQGDTLLLANAFPAADFNTAVYFILKAMNSLQLNPGISTVSFCSPLDDEQKIVLSSYFYSVDTI